MSLSVERETIIRIDGCHVAMLRGVCELAQRYIEQRKSFEEEDGKCAVDNYDPTWIEMVSKTIKELQRL